MDLDREQNPQPAPTPPGAVDKETKIKVFVMGGAIIFFFLMIVGWMISRPRTVIEQRPMPTQPPAKYPRIDPQKEADSDAGRPLKPFVPPPDGNRVDKLPLRAYQEPVTVEKKKTASDEYENLLKAASLAGNRVEGGKDGSDYANSRITDAGQPSPGSLPNHHDSGVDISGGHRNTNSDRQGAALIPQNTLPAGWFITCSLVNQLNGDNTGPVKVQVANDVYYPDTTDLAIPQGAIFLGEAQRVSGANQQRLAVGFSILQYRRDGKLYQVSLDKLPGLDQEGATALKDKVDNHYLQIFGVSLAVGAIGGLAQIGNGSYGGYSGIDPSVQIRNGATQQMAQNSAQILNRFLNRLPTITIRPGTPIIVFFPYGIDLQ